MIATPFDAFPIFVIVLLLIVIVPVVVGEELMIAIPLSLQSEMILSVACNVRVSAGVARTRAEPPLFDMVLPDAIISRVLNAPEVCM